MNSSSTLPLTRRRQRRAARKAAVRRRVGRILGASMIAVLGLGLLAGSSADESLAGWNDRSKAGTTLQTVDVDIKPWRAEKDAELIRVLRGMGQLLDESNDNSRFPRERTRELGIDQLAFDRTRHNLSFCRYSTGQWSVAGTTAYSARFFGRAGGINNIPLTEQYVFTSEGKLFHPSTTLAGAHRSRCEVDDFDINRRSTSGWLFLHNEGLYLRSQTHLDTFLVDNGDYPGYRSEPWKYDQASIDAWFARRDQDLIAGLQELGKAVDRSPNGQRVDLSLLDAVDVDPRSIDRTRLNFSYCNYDNGMWSVAATGLRSIADRNNLDHHYVLTSNRGLIRASQPLSSTHSTRCDADGINRSNYGSDWFWRSSDGLLRSDRRDSTWVIDSSIAQQYRQKPWAWEAD